MKEIKFEANGLRIRDSYLCDVTDADLTHIRKLLNAQIFQLGEKGGVSREQYWIKAKAYWRFLLTPMQFQHMISLIEAMGGKIKQERVEDLRCAWLNQVDDEPESEEIPDALTDSSFEDSESEPEPEVVEPRNPDIVSFADQLEELHQQIVLDDLPKAVYFLLGDSSSSLHRELIQAIDILVSARIAESERRLKRKFKKRGYVKPSL